MNLIRDRFFFLSKELMCVLNNKLNIIQVNPAFVKFFNKSSNELLHQPALRLLDNDNLADLENKLLHLIAQSTPQGLIFQSKILTNSSTYSTLEWMMDYDLDKGLIYCVGSDITELLYNKKEVETNAFVIQQIIDLVPHPIFLKDKNRKYILANKAQADLFSTTKNQLIGKCDDEFLKDLEEIEIILRSDRIVLDSSETITLPEQKITFSENIKILYTTKLPFNDADGERGLLGVSIDMTEIRNTERELKRTNFELDSFVYRSSHDMRAPLRSLLGLFNLINEDPNEETRKHCLDLAEQSVIKLDTFLVDLTNFSRNSRLEIEKSEVDFEELIKSCYQDLKYLEHIEHFTIEQTISTNQVYIGDAARIKIIFQNIISNAIKYRQSGSDSFLKIAVELSSDACYITFIDNGLGIKEEFKDKIFDMFFRASEHSFGSGLGLYIVKQIVEKLGGKISVFSEELIGTKFQIILPNSKK